MKCVFSTLWTSFTVHPLPIWECLPFYFETAFSFFQNVSDGKHGHLRLMKNGVNMSHGIADDQGDRHTMSGAAILELKAGDKVSDGSLKDVESYLQSCAKKYIKLLCMV